MNVYYVTSQIFAAAAFLLLIISVWSRRRKNLLFLQIAGGLMYTIQYLLIQYSRGYGLTGAVINIIGMIRTALLIKKTPGDKKYNVILAALLLLYTFAAAVTWNGIGSIFSYLTGISSTLGFYSSNTNRIRIFSCITCIFWMIYDFYIGAYVAMMGELCIITSNISSIVKVGANTGELKQWEKSKRGEEIKR